MGSSFIELPKKISDKKAVVNIQNNDHKCFLWSILASLHPAPNHVERVINYEQYVNDLDYALKGIEFPVKLDKLKLFEKRTNISINVYSFDEKYVVYPLLVTEDEKEQHVDLLYTKDSEETHYFLIKNLSGLVRSQKTKRKRKIWICKRCLIHFGREDLLAKHKECCK